MKASLTKRDKFIYIFIHTRGYRHHIFPGLNIRHRTIPYTHAHRRSQHDFGIQQSVESKIKMITCYGNNSPIVDMNVVLKASSENRKRMQVFPTPESPINNNLNK